MKPVIAVLWILSIALAVGLTSCSDPDRADSEPSSSFDPESRPSFSEVFRETDPLQRAYWISHSLQDLGPDNLPELLDVLENQNMGIVREEVRLVMIAWARFDPPGAYAWALEGQPPGWQKTLTSEAIYAWAFHDGPAAMRVVDEIEDAPRAGQLRILATDAWLRSDNKDSIAEYIANFPDVRRRGRLYFLLAGAIMVSEGADAAMRWVEAIPDDAPNNFKLGLFDHVANMVAAQDPEKAANWFLAHRTQPYSEGGLDGIARRWAQKDAPAAMAWLLALSPDGLRAGERDKAIGGAFRKWIQLNQGRAEKWLNNHLPNPELDPAIYEAVRRLMPIDVAKSMEWARRLEDRKQRNNQTVRVGVRWRNKDPEAFDDWLKENEIPEETLQRIGTKTLKSPQGGRATLNPNPATAGKR